MALADAILGTWTLVSSVDIQADGSATDTWGASPLGTYMFDAAGRFTQIVMRSDLPRTSSRDATTGDEAKAIVRGSLAQYGTYRVDEAAGIVTVHFVGSTFASFIGTEGRRAASMPSPDELVLSNTGRAGGASGRSVWRRVP